MKKLFGMVTLLLMLVMIVGCGKSDDGVYIRYWEDDEGQPWKDVFEIKGDKVTRKIVNKLEFAPKEWHGQLFEKEHKLELDTGEDESSNIKYSIKNDLMIIEFVSDHDTGKYYKEGSKQQIELQKKFEEDAERMKEQDAINGY